jgi:pilus assembly protein CpaB
MKSKTMILMIVAVACGLGASYMTSRLLAERNNEAKEEEKVKVLVAKRNVPQGTLIKVPEDWFIEKDFTVDDAPKKAVRNFDEVKDRVLSKALSAEQWVIADDLLRKDQIGFQLPKGMRAVTIKVNIDTVVGGFVQPNSRVDVINTVRGGDKEGYSQTILQNMLVLAVDTLDQRDIEKKAIISSNVTLAVTPDESQALALAQQLGELRLTLRASDDTEKVSIRTLKPDDLRNNRIQRDKTGSAEEDDGSKGGAVVGKLPDLPAADPMVTQPEPQPEPIKRKKPWVVVIFNGDQPAIRNPFVEDEDGDLVIQKSDAEGPRPKKPVAAPTPEKEAAPEKPSAPATPAPAHEKPRPAKRPAGS